MRKHARKHARPRQWLLPLAMRNPNEARKIDGRCLNLSPSKQVSLDLSQGGAETGFFFISQASGFRFELIFHTCEREEPYSPAISAVHDQEQHLLRALPPGPLTIDARQVPVTVTVRLREGSVVFWGAR